MNWIVVPSTEADARIMAPRMTATDAAEVWAMMHWTPLEAIQQSMRLSAVSYTWLVEGVPACMFGAGSEHMMGGIGRPWLLTTDLVKRCRIPFLRRYRSYLDELLGLYPVIETYVDARHNVCLRWLKWCGFDIAEPEPFGIDKLPFHCVRLEA